MENEPKPTVEFEEMQPIAVDLIEELPCVISHFQSDRNNVRIHESCMDARNLGNLSAICLNFTRAIAKAGNFGSVHQMTAFDEGSQFCLTSLNPQNVKPEGPRIIGMHLHNDVWARDVITHISASL